jgi:lipid II:glycine glycyltransferase (peptidoglycan interpeptide bridge formation enzyme)
MLDLSSSPEELFRNFHKDCVQRKVRRAEKESLTYESGNSDRLLNAFYRLMLQTRRKHQLPPQPIEWFRNLSANLGDTLQFRVAFKNGNEIASILTVQHKDTIVYKYGCSEAASQNLGATPFLFWKTILEAKAAGMKQMDLGRSDNDNPGLIAFKDRLGAKSSLLTYVRWSNKKESEQQTHHSHSLAKKLFAIMPDAVLEAAGRILYRHVA